jgi:hypothetical protein
MSEPSFSLDDVGYQNLRAVADRLLETTRVEYVDEGVLLIMNPRGSSIAGSSAPSSMTPSGPSIPALSPSTGNG